jgi:hypothetical protein
MLLKDLIIREGLENESAEDIVSTLNNKPLIPNPQPRGQVGRPVSSMEEIFALVNSRGNTVDPSQLEESELPAYQQALQTDLAVIGHIAQLIRDGKTIGEFIGIPSKGNSVGLVKLLRNMGLSQVVADGIEERLTLTVEDPSWVEEVLSPSLAELEGLGFITLEDVNSALENDA